MKAGSGKFPFRWKLMLVVSTLAVTATGVTAYLIYSSTRTMILEVMGGRLMDVARTSVNSMTPRDLEYIKSLKKTLQEKNTRSKSDVLQVAQGDTLESLKPKVAEELMEGDAFRRLVRILRNIKKSTVRVRESEEPQNSNI